MDKIDMMKRLIVGVDPGVTVGLAALSLDGLPVLIESRRSWSLSDLIKTISELGEATIVSSDVAPASELLERLSHKLNAVLFVPLISMGADEKRQVAKAYAEVHGFKLNNAHEVDALAAAVKAYQHYEKKLSQVKASVEKQGLKLQVDDVKNLVVRGYTVKAAVQTLLDSKKTKAPPVVRRRVPNEERMKSMIEELEGRLARERERSKHLKSANKELQAKIQALKDEIDKLNRKVAEARTTQSAEIRREREYQLLLGEYMKVKAKLSKHAEQLEEYRRRFDEMQRLRHLESQGRLILLKPIESFTENGLRKAFQLYGVKAGDSVLLLDPSGGGTVTAEKLVKRGVKVVAAHGSMSHQALEAFARNMIPVVSSGELRIEWIEGLPYADSESVRKAVKGAAKEASQTEVSKAYDEFKTILEDHRKEVTEKK
jgi:predicted RNase H-like nuclease (RuvC/YqgF family)